MARKGLIAINTDLVFLIEIVISVAAIILLGRRRLQGNIGFPIKIMAVIIYVCSTLLALSVSSAVTPKRSVTIIPAKENNEAALGYELTIAKINVNGKEMEDFTPSAGKWTLYEGQYRWFEPGDKRSGSNTTDAITYEFFQTDKIEISFWGNEWKGIAVVEADGMRYTVDTYSASGGAVRFSLPASGLGQALRAAGIAVAAFFATLLVLLGAAYWFLSIWKRVVQKYGNRGPLKKLLSYQFLFEELVSRDFKKKYKRTVLGVVWSILSPLLTLLVMRLVFTQFFGRATAHYTTYLFCGNLLFSYFHESTSQGMTSLVGNAGIFTKVNVPKYLFLLSKNVQTLINFGLTLCVFFVFCVLDNITFTWRFICLLYPIALLVLFNIGIGLILSALFVFFKDIQYLWSVFTMLLMYMSAIFYTIDNYEPMVRNLFLLNPVYLFIRYFRKIVIEATIPTIWFHLLMLADVAVVLGVGCWMYKRYNTKFLYYV